MCHRTFKVAGASVLEGQKLSENTASRHLTTSWNRPRANIQNEILFEHRNPSLGSAGAIFHILFFISVYLCFLGYASVMQPTLHCEH
jgi:hypothetical protein